MEKPVSPCCAKMGIKKNKGCCEHKQFFSKLSIEGFTAKHLQLRPPGSEANNHLFSNDFTSWNKITLEHHFSGLPPPDNVFKIKTLLQPSPVELQNFRC